MKNVPWRMFLKGTYLTYEEVVNIHTQVLCVYGVEGVLSVYECCCTCSVQYV